MESSLRNVALSELGDTIGTPPSARLQESVERLGIIQPVLLAEQTSEDGEIRLAVIDGNRRIAASRKAKFTYIPGFVLSGLSVDEIAQWTLVANGFRASNYLSEYWAIRHLERQNYSLTDIRDISGMGGQSIELRNLLAGLNRDLFVGLRHGKISQADAMAAAKLEPREQDALAEIYRERGRFTRADIRALVPPETTDPSPDKLNDELQAAIETALALDMSKENFLALASRLWDCAG